MRSFLRRERAMDGHYAPDGVSFRSTRSRLMPILAATIVLAGFAGQHVLAADDKIASASFDVSADKFLRWNKDSCVFEPADAQAGKYAPELRKSPKPIRIVFTPE